MEVKQRIIGGVLGVAVGDALGVPVEFTTRDELKQNPLRDMIGYGVHYQPPGTWSDDTSLMLATIAGIIEAETIGQSPLEMIATNFVKWKVRGEFTAHGEVFDIGGTTYKAIVNLEKGISPRESGLSHEYSQANGSLMRTLPASLYFLKKRDGSVKKALKGVHEVSAITHAHPSCLLACGIYTLFLKQVLHGFSLRKCYEETCNLTTELYQEPRFEKWLTRFDRILSGRLTNLDEKDISADGYVVNSLEAALWSVLTTKTFEEAVIRAINLGLDTDTVGAIAGGLAGVYYGMENIPAKWRKAIAKNKEIINYGKSLSTLLEKLGSK